MYVARLLLVHKAREGEWLLPALMHGLVAEDQQ